MVKSGANDAFELIAPFVSEKEHQNAAARVLYRLPFESHESFYLEHVIAEEEPSGLLAFRLVEQDWRDESMLPQLLRTLEAREKPSYLLIVLIRHFTNWEVGPDTKGDWNGKEEGPAWKERVLKWGRKEGLIK